jgi:hypothetical protein
MLKPLRPEADLGWQTRDVVASLGTWRYGGGVAFSGADT